MITMSDKISFSREKSFTSESDPDYEEKVARGEVDENTRLAVEASKRGAEKYNTEEKAQKAMAEAGLTQEIRARFKIEISFGAGRTTAGPNLVGIQIWESGKKLHGGGDELMYYCQILDPNKSDGCWSAISGDNIGYNQQTGEEIAFCSKCMRKWDPSKLTTMRVFRLPTRKIAEIIETMFRQLQSNADIYCKYHPTDIRYQAMLKEKGLAKARKLKGMHMYRLHNILKDTGAGADLQGRIFAFLSS